MKQLTMASLFDGSGGFPLASILSGITPIWASEIEPFPIRVTTKRLPQMKHYGDVSKIKGDEVEPVDIITFGSPCQDLSVAGKRNGLDGERSGLFHQAMRIVKENIAFALAVKLIILVLGALGLTTMWLAVFGDVGVAVIAILNSMRALKYKK